MTPPADAESETCCGRPSLSGSGISPQITVRLPAELRARTEALADADGVCLSAWAREAISERVQRRTPRV